MKRKSTISEAVQAKEALEKAVRRIEKTGLKDFTEYLQSPWKMIASNFVAGTFRGLGFFLGASLVLAVFAFVVTKILVDIPIVGEFFSSLLSFLQENAQFTNGGAPGGG